jgi:sarcosine oxidase
VSHRNHKYDYIVLGLGAMGSSTLYHLAKRNSNVLGIEQFKVNHSYGSSHGLSRIIRMAYFESPDYVDMLRRSYYLWDQLEHETNEKLLTKTGSLDIGKKDSKIVIGSKLTCEEQKLEHTFLNQEELINKFPGWHDIPKEMDVVAVYQPDGGILNPEKCTSAHVKQAIKMGVKVHEEEKFIDLKIYGKNEVLVKTNKSEYLTSKIILSPGAWLGGFLKNCPELNKLKAFQKISSILTPQRNVVIWYKSSKPDLYQTHNFPVFILDIDNEMFYGFPITNNGESPHEKFGFKIGKYHHRKQNLSYEMLNSKADWRTNFDREDEQVLGAGVKLVLKDAYGPVLKQTACIFTNTPDEHFIIDPCPDPDYPCVAVVSACSGHGFKFSSVIGEIMATLVTQKTESYQYSETDWLRAKRFF